MALMQKGTSAATAIANLANALKSAGPVTGRAGSHGWRFSNRGFTHRKNHGQKNTDRGYHFFDNFDFHLIIR